MVEYATKQDVQKIVDRAVEKVVADLSEVMSSFAQQVDARFNKIEKEIAELRESHQRLLNTIDGFVARIDHYEIEMAAR